MPPVPAHGQPFNSRVGTIAAYYPGRDEVCANLYWFGSFEPWIDVTLRRLASEGDIAIDIGANIGATTLVLARTVGPKGKVYAFEPHPRNAAKLRTNVAINGLRNVHIEQLALSDRDGMLHLQDIPGQPGMARVRVGGNLAITATSFNHWAARHALPRITVCKIDVEGHELPVVRGMSAWFPNIASFVFERHNATGDDELLGLFMSHGYNVFRIEKAPLSVHYVPVGEKPRARPTSDYVAVQKDLLNRVK